MHICIIAVSVPVNYMIRHTEAVIGFLNTTLSIVEGDSNNHLNFSIGILQGYLDFSVTINFMTENITAQGNSMVVTYS